MIGILGTIKKTKLDKKYQLGLIETIELNMPSDFQIAEGLLAACLEADHKPGKVQFTKYLYLLDYCNWRFKGRKSTSFPWKFHSFGPWCEEVENCMSRLASQYAFDWREEDVSFVRSVEVPAFTPDIQTKSLISQIVGMFKDRDLNVLLEVTYSQTEPMLMAKRGDLLDFSSIPVDKQMPSFFPPVAKESADFQIHPERRRMMDAFRERADALREKAKQRMAFRETESYIHAMTLLGQEFGVTEKLPETTGTISSDAAEGLAER